MEELLDRLIELEIERYNEKHPTKGSSEYYWYYEKVLNNLINLYKEKFIDCN